MLRLHVVSPTFCWLADYVPYFKLYMYRYIQGHANTIETEGRNIQNSDFHNLNKRQIPKSDNCVLAFVVTLVHPFI